MLALPDWVDRVINANTVSGSRQDKFLVWPTSEPMVRIAKGETMRLSFRITLVDKDVSQVAGVVPVSPQFKQPPTAPPGPRPTSVAGSNAPATSPLPEGKLTYQVKEGARPGVYWLDLDLGPIDDIGTFSYSLSLPSNAMLAGLNMALIVSVVADDFMLFPPSSDFGEIKLPDPADGVVQIGRFGLRRPLRKFLIRELSSSLPFIQVSSQAIVEGNNYYIKVEMKNDGSVKAGQYDGKIRIATNDKQQATIEVPFNVKLLR